MGCKGVFITRTCYPDVFCISDATQIPDSSETYPSLSHQHYSESQTQINKHMSLQVHTDGHSQSVRIPDNLDNDTEEFPFVPPSTKDSESDIEVRPDCFHFSFYGPSRPIFLKIEKKNKRDFFLFLFFYFPPTHANTALEFNYVFFSICLFYCSQVDLIISSDRTW